LAVRVVFEGGLTTVDGVKEEDRASGLEDEEELEDMVLSWLSGVEAGEEEDT
jgi:hypothetical protein